jgi:energy-coupling factor transporter ATP-binding protein EcfA2
VHEPPVLVLDEPTSSLDPRQRHDVRELIAGLKGRHTVILSTHILPEVSDVADRVVIITAGRRGRRHAGELAGASARRECDWKSGRATRPSSGPCAGAGLPGVGGVDAATGSITRPRKAPLASTFRAAALVTGRAGSLGLSGDRRRSKRFSSR